MTRHDLSYEHVGEVPVWVLDLEKRWQEEDARQRVYVGPEDSAFNMELDIDAPPQIVWDYLNAPGRRLGWQHLTGTTGIEQLPGDGGRRKAGTVNHCAHGEAMVVEEILDYRPNDYVTLGSANPGLPFKMVMTFELEPTELEKSLGNNGVTCIKRRRTYAASFDYGSTVAIDIPITADASQCNGRCGPTCIQLTPWNMWTLDCLEHDSCCSATSSDSCWTPLGECGDEYADAQTDFLRGFDPFRKHCKG